MSSRGWCYLLEEYGLTKGDFDKAQGVINDCRKSGLLPLDICAEDEARTADGIPEISPSDKSSYLASWFSYIKEGLAEKYSPLCFTDFQDVYLEMLVEKIDLKGIFGPVCERFHIPYANARGWCDMNGRAALMRRFQAWAERGKRCVLLYCGDHDPGGLCISETLGENLADMSQAVGWNPSAIKIDRFGLNYDFIDEQGLTWIDNLVTGSGKNLADPKHADFDKAYVQNYLTEYGPRKCEANALVTRIDAGRALCESSILKYLDPTGIEEYERETAKERRGMQKTINTYFEEHGIN